MAGRMTRFFTADLHFGHVNIIRYCDRPVPNVDAMNEGLVERWNAAVTDDDEVWVLGDVAMGQILDSLRHVRRLAGTKCLVPGNHDRCWPGHGPRAQPWVDRYLEVGFAEILPEIVALSVAGRAVRACHFPYHGDSRDEQRFDYHRPADDGACCSTVMSTPAGASKAARSTSAAMRGTTARSPRPSSSHSWRSWPRPKPPAP
jgi:calcineurin-like phosphoesterase family protein